MRACKLAGRATNVTADEEGCTRGATAGSGGQSIQCRNGSTERQGSHQGLNQARFDSGSAERRRATGLSSRPDGAGEAKKPFWSSACPCRRRAREPALGAGVQEEGTTRLLRPNSDGAADRRSLRQTLKQSTDPGRLK
jgi:hypothetical protein